jgi:hypothetical protein
MKQYVLLLSACLYLTACQNSSRPNIDSVKFPPPNAEALMTADPGTKSIEGDQTDNTQTTLIASSEKKIIKEGEISLETGDLKAARKTLSNTLNKLGGYIDEESENTDTYSDRKNYVFKTRIPVQNFEKFLNTVSAAADHVESKSIRIKDVTTEYIDVTTRLNNKKLLENRYKDLLAKAGKMADILEVENKLNEIRTDIEITQGQLNYLNKQIAYSSLEITFFTKSTVGNNEGNGFGYKIKKAFGDSWDLLQNMFFGLITLWPVILLVIGLLIVLRVWIRRRRLRKD